jgi:hypothetical protein
MGRTPALPSVDEVAAHQVIPRALGSDRADVMAALNAASVTASVATGGERRA